ncbi:zinc-binding dehydrogenase [Pseudalkalibacillus caeni]|uniref:NAD(P)-dependent alcohol dehydrogenase n=1 Tax=Exobacillus caeni TaxID=2574798 RepID=A0A5R9FBA1_9BACL|nr:zinc-binding dehydrogenase [Pseudalkalibacillus caeni]TLS38163.1 NAD(P)-dependent alcohol dehydrogenase [Pseudalkalibacillus caeni]
MKAITHAGQEGIEGLSYSEMPENTTGAGEVKVRLKAAGLNHRDLFVLHRHKPEDPALIIGSDGAGIIEAVGAGVHNLKEGDEVIINPGLGWIHNSEAPPQGFEIVGFPDHGTFAESIVLPEENVEPKPQALSWEQAGVLGLAGLTAYRALFTRGKLKKGQTVLIPGIGSGVATFLLQYAKAAGANVIVTSRSEQKRNHALELGADLAIDSNGDWGQEITDKVDLVIDSVGEATFNKSLDQLRPGGTIVTFGASAGDEVKIDIRKFFYGQFNMLGSTMGSKEEFQAMLSFIKEQNIFPVIDRMFSLDQAIDAFKHLDRAEQFGKVGFVIQES